RLEVWCPEKAHGCLRQRAMRSVDVVLTGFNLKGQLACERAGDVCTLDVVIEAVRPLEYGNLTVTEMPVGGEGPPGARVAGAHRARKRAELPMCTGKPLVFAADTEDAGAEIVQPGERAAAAAACVRQCRAIGADDQAVCRRRRGCGGRRRTAFDREGGMRQEPGCDESEER